MADRTYTPREIAIRGEAIYRERIHELVHPVERDSFIVIDVESGEYEVDASDAVASRRLLDRRPNAMTYAVRAGHLAAYSHPEGSSRLEQAKKENASGDQQARLTLEIIDAEGCPSPVEMVLDTRFTGCLTLPTATIRQLGLSHVGHRTLEMDGEALLDAEAYLVPVSLQGHLTDVLVLRSDGAPLVGMSLLLRSRIALHTIAEGATSIQELQARAPESVPITSGVKRFRDRIWGFVKRRLFPPISVAAALVVFGAIAFGIISIPLDFGELLTFMGIWLALGVLLGQNKPPTMPSMQYLLRRGVGLLCCYVFFVVIIIAYQIRGGDTAQMITGEELWSMLVLSLVGFVVGFFAGQDKEKNR